MTNVQHSSKSNLWYTPDDIIEKARTVLGGIDFDPASDSEANKTVKAGHFYSENSLTTPWLPGSIFLNPPGGKIGNQSQQVLFWQKLMKHRENHKGFTHAIFLAFSLEALQTTQKEGHRSICDFTYCIPSKRLHFKGSSDSPSHGSAIVYVPGIIDKYNEFQSQFSDVGSISNWVL